jgi:hypothetical protein
MFQLSKDLRYSLRPAGIAGRKPYSQRLSSKNGDVNKRLDEEAAAVASNQFKFKWVCFDREVPRNQEEDGKHEAEIKSRRQHVLRSSLA